MSELVTNAIVHTPGEIKVCAAIGGSVLRIEVTDEWPDCDPIAIADPARDGSGRGLRIVDAVALTWGCRAGPGRKVVWAELDLFADR